LFKCLELLLDMEEVGRWNSPDPTTNLPGQKNTIGRICLGGHKSLLIDTAIALQSTDVEGVLGIQVARAGGFYLATGLNIEPLSRGRFRMKHGGMPQ